jgi:endonuclease/exonuclease/phosphatase family metal-dependent hydrolase
MSSLRIATLNCLNLALPGRRFYPGSEPYSPDEYIAKTQWLALMVDRLGADVLLLQEIFHEQALSDVIRQTAGQGKAWQLAVPLADSANTRPRLGIVWKSGLTLTHDSIEAFAPGGAVQVPETGEHARFSRPVLRAHLAWPGRPGLTLTLLNVHLKSRRPEYASGEDEREARAQARGQLRALLMRAAEAAALRALVVEATRDSRQPLIVAGDFNDEPHAVTTQIVADTSWKPDERQTRDTMLFNALDIEQRLGPGRGRDVAFTVLHAGEPERIDHVLVSEEFVPHSKFALGRVAGVEIYNDHLRERRQRQDAGRGRGANGPDLMRILSDHAAVCVSIVLDDPR